MTYTALLCLGLTLFLRTSVLPGACLKPILRVHPDSVVYKQTGVTFICKGTKKAKAYRLYKEEIQYVRCSVCPQNAKNKAECFISEIGQQHAGQYRCQYQTDDGWSEYSDALELVVTGAYSKPSLSAQPSPVVTEGGMLTLQCASRQQHDRFILTKEGPQRLSWTLGSQYNYHTQQYQAQFPVGPVTSSQRWTFRCYSFDKNSPQVWSEPSDPLVLLVSGQEKYLTALIGVSVAFLLFLFMFIFLLLRQKIQRKFRKDAQKEMKLQLPPGATEPLAKDRGPKKKRCVPAADTLEESLYTSLEDMQTEHIVELESWRPPKEDPQEETYAQVKPFRLRTAGTVSPCVMSREFLDTNGGQAEEGGEMDTQAEEPQDVTYAQLFIRSLKQGTADSPPF